MRAKTSFQALFLTERATGCHSNATRAPFNRVEQPPRHFLVSFNLARIANRPLLSGRTMRFSVGTTSIALAAASLISISCEKHHVGELPEVQKEKVDLPAGREADSSGAHAA